MSPRDVLYRAARRAALVLVLALLCGVWLTLAARRGGWPPPPSRAPLAPVSTARPAARPDPRTPRAVRGGVFVLDGDTLRIEGQDVRLLGADTPERAAPWFEGAQEPWASRATAWTRGALSGARCVEWLPVGADERGRTLGHVWVDGRPLAALLVEAGLAYETVSRFGDGGRPDVARAITSVRRRRLDFEPPWRWRQRHRTPDAARLKTETQSEVSRPETPKDRK
jgi:endonuclease YncB( thermonuclease family)